MSRNADQIPIYAADGTSLGYRSRDAAHHLLRAGFVTATYGRKGHLKAIFLQQEGDSNPVRAGLKVGTRYSYEQRLGNGRLCWNLKKLDQRGEGGKPLSTRSVFSQVVQDCLVP